MLLQLSISPWRRGLRVPSVVLALEGEPSVIYARLKVRPTPLQAVRRIPIVLIGNLAGRLMSCFATAG
jgi:hypothetical protein